MSSASKVTYIALAIAFSIGARAYPSHASSPDAWAEFRSDVEKACRGLAAAERLVESQIVVNPLGSSSFGVAIVKAKAGPKEPYTVYACVYDKRTKRAELTVSFADPLP